MMDAFDGPFPDPYGCGAVIFLGTDCAETTAAGGARAPESATGAADDAGSDGDDSAEDGFNATSLAPAWLGFTAWSGFGTACWVCDGLNEVVEEVVLSVLGDEAFPEGVFISTGELER
jgi:hypothetical protein